MLLFRVCGAVGRAVVLKSTLLLLCCALLASAKGQHPEKVKVTDASGKVIAEGRMKGNDKTGIWLWYDSEGRLTKREKWSKGQRQWSVMYNERNRPVSGTNAKGDTIRYKGCNCPR